MKISKYFILAIFWQYTFAQNTVPVSQKLDTIFLSGFFQSQNIEIENLSPLLKKNINKITSSSSLKEFLDAHTNLFFKEYGRGMLSSISIRGTGASHTLVLWNGIPINSKLNGQVDFNSIYFTGLDRLQLKRGGESILFGSGAIGGVIETGESISFVKKKTFSNSFHYGSFSSIFNHTKIKLSDNRYFLSLNFTTDYSKNDYLYPDKNLKNTNGKYRGNDYQLSIATKIDQKNILSLHSHYNTLSRNLSGTLYAPSNSKLNTKNNQQLFSWKFHQKKINNVFTIAYVYEEYKYFPNKDITDSSLSKSENFIIKNETEINTSKSQFNFGNLFENVMGVGDHIQEHRLQSYSIYGNWLYRFKHFHIQTGIRKEFHSSYSIPLMGRLKMEYLGFHKNFRTGVSLSSNYKVPNINDLYWNPGGNQDLKPEKSRTYELFAGFSLNNFHTKLTGFYIDSKDLIKWTPFTSNLWKPINFEKVKSKGIELEAHTKLKILSQTFIKLNGSFSYQQVINSLNNNLLPYVPMETAFIAMNVEHGKWDFLLSGKYVGKVFTTTSNTLYIPSHQIINTKMIFRYNNSISIGGGINNLLNTYYETFPSRPQPGRNYNININIKINKS